jgi:hypothetical protein
VSPRSAYQPLWPGRRPGGRPEVAPVYRVLVHRKFSGKWDELPERVGIDAAQRFWDHISKLPGAAPAVGSTCILRGKAGLPQGPGWSKTVHYELSSMARVNYQHNEAYRTTANGDPHKVVAVLSIDFSSH